MANENGKGKEESGKMTALAAALGQIEKSYGKGAVMRMGDTPIASMDVIHSGSMKLDAALGVGGYPRGRIVEIFGPESGGKTTLALHAIAECQKVKGTAAAFIDAEHALDPVYARNLGVDVENLYISQPDYGEQALDIAEKMIRSGAVDIVVVDSVAALVPRNELEGEMGQATVGLQARLMSSALRRLTSAVSQSNCVLIFINQLREKVGIMFGNPETTPGGRALKFYSSIRLDVRRTETLKESGEAISNLVKVKVVKNKVAPPFKEAILRINFGKGIDVESEILDVAIERGLVIKAGSWFSLCEDLGGGRMCQGLENAKRYIFDRPELREKLLELIDAGLVCDV